MSACCFDYSCIACKARDAFEALAANEQARLLAAVRHASAIVAGDVTPRDDWRDPYARDITTLRAASSTPESRFEDEYKASRQAEFDAQQRALERAPEFRTLSAKPDDTPEIRAAKVAERRELHRNEFRELVDLAFAADAENPHLSETIDDDPSLTPADPYKHDLDAMKKDRK